MSRFYFSIVIDASEIVILLIITIFEHLLVIIISLSDTNYQSLTMSSPNIFSNYHWLQPVASIALPKRCISVSQAAWLPVPDSYKWAHIARSKAGEYMVGFLCWPCCSSLPRGVKACSIMQNNVLGSSLSLSLSLPQGSRGSTNLSERGFRARVLSSNAWPLDSITTIKTGYKTS